MRYVSPTVFAAIVLFFAMPFGAAVSCENVKHYEWTGFDLVAASVEAPPEYRDDERELESRWIFAWPVLAAAVLGLGLGVFWRARYAGLAAVAGLAATIALIAVPEPVTNEQPEWGLLVTLLTFGALALVHAIAAGVRLWRRRRSVARTERNEPVGASLR